jgi:hypothetical protein
MLPPMKIQSVLSIASLVASLAAALVACSDGDSVDNDKPTGTGGASATTSGSGGVGGSMSSAVSCDEYCDSIMANCTGQNQQYQAGANCLATCQHLELGTRSDRTGNSVACRLYYAGAPAKNDPAQCVNAGPSGGDIPTGGDKDHCGPTCDSFCAIIMGTCTGANEVYADEKACMDACNSFESTTAYKLNVSGDNLACRLYHATAAAADPDVHCSHTKVDSPVCN